MLRWYKNLFIGNTAKPDASALKQEAEQGKFRPGLYLITLASNGIDQLDIVNAALIIPRSAAARLPLIIGMAVGYEEALAVFQDIAVYVFEETGDCRIREYFQERADET